MARNSPPLIILAFVSFLQGLAPEVRTPRKSQLQQGPPTLCMEHWMATETATQTGATLSLGHTKGCCTGQSPAVCNSWGSADRALCSSTLAGWLRHKKDFKTGCASACPMCRQSITNPNRQHNKSFEQKGNQGPREEIITQESVCCITGSSQARQAVC